ncbi:MAG: hypothetical protein R3E84_08835 [Pseudomonadales bacterium]
MTPAEQALIERFSASMQIDYERWHDGVGYDLDTINAATPPVRQAIETLLLARGIRDWRDAEALAALSTPRAVQCLEDTYARADAADRLMIARHAAHLVDTSAIGDDLAAVLRTARLGYGLGEAIDSAATVHPPPVVQALIDGLTQRDGTVATLFAGLLFHIWGHSDDPFDVDHRDRFLQFHAPDPAEREQRAREFVGRYRR